MREVTVTGGTLVVKTADQEVQLDLGAHVAERWLRLIKEPKGLFEKLEVTPQSRVAAVDVTDSLFLTALRERTQSVAEGRVPEGVPVVFFGAETREALRKLTLCARAWWTRASSGSSAPRAAGHLRGRRVRRRARQRAGRRQGGGVLRRRTRRTSASSPSSCAVGRARAPAHRVDSPVVAALQPKKSAKKAPPTAKAPAKTPVSPKPAPKKAPAKKAAKPNKK